MSSQVNREGKLPGSGILVNTGILITRNPRGNEILHLANAASRDFTLVALQKTFAVLMMNSRVKNTPLKLGHTRQREGEFHEFFERNRPSCN